jgi:hypothetical protein
MAETSEPASRGAFDNEGEQRALYGFHQRPREEFGGWARIHWL